MKFHNLMEDIVLKFLEELINEKKEICKCEQCKSDIICYTLNKIKPLYITSSRGIIHTENQKRYNFQDDIDVMTTLNEAIEVVSAKKRHSKQKILKSLKDKNSKIKDRIISDNENYFNFPQMIGRVFDSSDLSPIDNASVILTDETGKNKIEMFDENWLNPISIVLEMNGSFSFWPQAIKSEKEGIQKDFQMSLIITKDGYEPVSKYFYIRALSEKGIKTYITKENAFYIDDIYISKGNLRGGR